MIELEGVTKAYATAAGEVRALDEFSLEVPAGKYLAVRGHSGSGKSTLLSLIGGLATPTNGVVRVDGQEVSSMSAGKRAAFRAEKIGFVFQMFHLLPYLSVVENVVVAATGDASGAEERATRLLTEFGLDQRFGHRPGQLSAGERQRVAMARALLNNPPLLLADEPTGNLDPDSADAVLDLLQRFHESGGTVVLATHDDRAASRAQDVLHLSKGRVMAA